MALFSVVVIQNNFEISKISEMLHNFPLMFGHILYALTLCVTVIVVAVPEGLPMMITLVLSSNMKKMLKNNVLVRKLVGIETAGNLNILFTDKTGTLTKGKLEVIGIMTGDFKTYQKESDIKGKVYSTIKDSMVYNNASCYSEDKIIGGNSTDRAILGFIKTPISPVQVLKTVPFDSKNKYMLTTIVACPTCGRTQIDLIPIAKEVEEFLQTIDSNITVAVMGCAVNGPGEAKNADIGIAGGIKEGLLFKKGKIIRKIPQDKIVEELKKEILEMVK